MGRGFITGYSAHFERNDSIGRSMALDETSSSPSESEAYPHKPAQTH